MAHRSTPASEPTAIDPATLERMGRIARGLPGRTVSVAQAAAPGSALPRRARPIAVTLPVLSIDGVVAAEIVASYERHDAG